MASGWRGECLVSVGLDSDAVGITRHVRKNGVRIRREREEAMLDVRSDAQEQNHAAVGRENGRGTETKCLTDALEAGGSREQRPDGREAAARSRNGHGETMAVWLRG